MSNSIVPFSFESNTIRTITDENGEPWFVAKDISDCLGYSNPSKAVSDHCKLTKSLNAFTSNESLEALPGNTLCIPEPDIYRLVARSRLPESERFEKCLRCLVGDVRLILSMDASMAV